jgi:hypothetical protein
VRTTAAATQPPGTDSTQQTDRRSSHQYGTKN